MSQTESLTPSADDLTAAGPLGHVSQISFPVTDDELLLLLQDQPGALLKLYPEGEQTLSPPVINAVKRCLIARRALAPDDTGRLALLEPFAGLVDALISGRKVCRITTNQDDQRARLVLVTDDAVFTLDRDPNGINDVTITPDGTAAALATEALAHDDGVQTDPAQLGAEPVRLRSDALAEGRRLLEQGAFEEAEAILGEAYRLLVAAGNGFRIETLTLVDGRLDGDEFDILDAHDLGWLTVSYAGDGSTDVIVRQLADADLLEAVGSAVSAG